MTDIQNFYKERGQGHVFAHFETLSEAEQEKLLQQAAAIDLDEIDHLVKSLIQNPDGANSNLADELSPADYIPMPGNAETSTRNTGWP